jgi:hypothetical protein
MHTKAEVTAERYGRGHHLHPEPPTTPRDQRDPPATRGQGLTPTARTPPPARSHWPGCLRRSQGSCRSQDQAARAPRREPGIGGSRPHPRGPGRTRQRDRQRAGPGRSLPRSPAKNDRPLTSHPVGQARMSLSTCLRWLPGRGTRCATQQAVTLVPHGVSLRPVSARTRSDPGRVPSVLAAILDSNPRPESWPDRRATAPGASAARHGYRERAVAESRTQLAPISGHRAPETGRQGQSTLLLDRAAEVTATCEASDR